MNILEGRVDFGIIISSLSGAMVYMLARRQSGGIARWLYFFISFFMGIVGADLTLEIIGNYIPGVFMDKRAFGAFFCSSLVVTVILGTINWVERFFKKK